MIAVEPNADSVKVIQENLAVNGWGNRAKIIQAALSDHDGEGYLQIEELSWSHTLTDMAPANGHTSEKVQLVTIQSILDGEHPDIIKCNAEGGEFSMVKSMVNDDTLRPRMIILMVHPDKNPEPDYDIFADLRRIGYHIEEAFKDDNRPIYHCILP